MNAWVSVSLDPRRFARLLALVVVAWSLLASASAEAREAGLASTLFLGRSPPSCNSCHSGGTAPTVTLMADDTTLGVGQQITLTVTVTSVNGNPGGAGFNLRSSQQGTFAVGGSASANTRTITGTNGWLEATHSAPKTGEPVTFTTLWTPVAATSGSVTFTVWGNAVNVNGTNGGDQAASTTLAVTVASCTPVTWYRDVDGDGYGAASSGTQSACTAPTGYVANGNDCNDGSAAVHPGAAETCNGADDDCTGGVDNGLAFATYYRDQDDDDYGSTTHGTVQACALRAGYVANQADCDDDDASVHPGATESCNGVDDDCDGATDELAQCGVGGGAGSSGAGTGGALGGAGGSLGVGGAPVSGGAAGSAGATAGTLGNGGVAGTTGGGGVTGSAGGPDGTEEGGAAGDVGDGGEAGVPVEPGGRGGADSSAGTDASGGAPVGTGGAATAGSGGSAGAVSGGASGGAMSSGGRAGGGAPAAGAGPGGAPPDDGCGCRLTAARGSGSAGGLVALLAAAAVCRRRFRRTAR